LTDWIQQISDAQSLEDLENIRIAAMGKKGEITAEFATLKDAPADEKPKIAKRLNDLRDSVMSALMEKKTTLQDIALIEGMKAENIDVTRFTPKRQRGGLHPVMEVMDDIIEFFSKRNFFVETGPMVEDDFHNFEALNLPKHHPARDMQDTFYFKDHKLLRTHTSPVQIRTMKQIKPPFRMIAPGTVFRRDFDITHTPMFHQVEGLVVDAEGKVSFANLKEVLQSFLTHMFGDVDVRFRPSFFPFTEPSAEVDISCVFCQGDGCRVCSHTGWLEVLGCGMVDPNVFEAVGYSDVSGYAFGLGVERFAMLLYGIGDLRSLFEGDLRLLEQFA
jgi:phenylalanyl-tRNA synthetase alpha chain